MKNKKKIMRRGRGGDGRIENFFVFKEISLGIFSSVQSLDRLGRRGEHKGQFSRDPLPVFSAGGPCEQLWHRQGCPLFDVVHPTFPLPTAASPVLRGALKDGFREAIVACDMPEPCKFPSPEETTRYLHASRRQTLRTAKTDYIQ